MKHPALLLLKLIIELNLKFKIMKKLVLAIAMFILSFSLHAQQISKAEWRKMSRQERKEYKQKIAEANQLQIMQLMTSRAWVLEAHQIQDKYGESAIIEPSLNFVGVAGCLTIPS